MVLVLVLVLVRALVLVLVTNLALALADLFHCCHHLHWFRSLLRLGDHSSPRCAILRKMLRIWDRVIEVAMTSL